MGHTTLEFRIHTFSRGKKQVSHRWEWKAVIAKLLVTIAILHSQLILAHHFINKLLTCFRTRKTKLIPCPLESV